MVNLSHYIETFEHNDRECLDGQVNAFLSQITQKFGSRLDVLNVTFQAVQQGTLVTLFVQVHYAITHG